MAATLPGRIDTIGTAVTRSTRAAIGAALAVLLGWPASTFAHGSPISLSVWGNFRTTAAACQREIGRGATLCGLRAWDVRRSCLLRQMDGGSCDEEADDDAIDAARRAAFDAVRPRCSELDLGFLQFNSLFDVQTDMVTYCRDLEDAAVSVVFNPFLAAGEELDPQSRTCVQAFAAVTTKALRNAIRVHELTLDRIAARAKAPPEKRADVMRAQEQVDAAMQSLRDILAAQCPEETFLAVYGHSLSDLLELVSTRADCLAVATYPVDAYTCPAAVCGNGMNERGESCDDGNLVDNDGCSSSCIRD